MNTKNFSILKWIVFPVLVLLFGAGILYTSIKVFTVEGSIPYIILLSACLGISLIFVLHTSNHANRGAKIAAFVFEAGGVIAIGVTSVMGILALREYSGMTQTIEYQSKQDSSAQKERTAQIEQMAKLRSARAQTEIAKSMNQKPPQDEQSKLTMQDVYTKAESYLLIPLIVEVGWYLLGLIVVFGIVIFADFGKTLEVQDSLYDPQYATATIRNSPARAKFEYQSVKTRKHGKFKRFEADDGKRLYTLYFQMSGYIVRNEASVYVGHISHRKFDAANPQTYDEVKGLL